MLFKIREYIRCFVRQNKFLSRINDLRNKEKDSLKREEFRANGLSVAKRVECVLHEAGIPSFLMFGSLLGAVREKSFMPHDYDVDFAVVIDEPAIWDSIERALIAHGFEKHLEYRYQGNITEQCYKSSHMTFDVFGCFRVDGGEMARVFSCTKYSDTIYERPDQVSVIHIDIPLPEKLVSANVGGIELAIPDNAEKILAVAYGANWMYPDPTWKWGTGAIRDGDEGSIARY